MRQHEIGVDVRMRATTAYRPSRSVQSNRDAREISTQQSKPTLPWHYDGTVIVAVLHDGLQSIHAAHHGLQFSISSATTHWRGRYVKEAITRTAAAWGFRAGDVGRAVIQTILLRCGRTTVSRGLRWKLSTIYNLNSSLPQKRFGSNTNHKEKETEKLLRFETKVQK